MARVALVLTLLLAVAARGECIDEGHYAIVADVETLRGTAWPYSEDLVGRSDQKPIGDGIVVAFDPKLPWTKIQTGCAAHAERNVYASEEVNLVLRASFTFSFDSRKTAVTGARYQVQLRLDGEVVLDETRRLDGRYPQSHRFGTVAANIPRGEHVYSMWFRLLDGPATNAVTLGLQWLTSQGMPSRFPVATQTMQESQRIVAKWTAITPAMHVKTTTTSDLILLTSIDAAENVQIGYTIDDGSGRRTPREPMLTRSMTFDQRLKVPPGIYAIRLWARTLQGASKIERARFHVAAFPTMNSQMFEAGANEPMVVTPLGSADEPVTLEPICGRWTKLLDFQTPPSDGDFSWFLHLYAEFPRVVGHGYVEIAVQTVRNQPTPRLGTIEATDMGIAVAQLSPGGDAVSYYGDASSWGNDGGNSMSLWIRIIEGCNDAAFGNELTVGRRWVAVKLLPTTSLHLP